MKAIVYHNYGSPDVLKLKEVKKPIPGDNEVLIKVRAASVNPIDWYGMKGRPYIGRLFFGLRKPKETRVGFDFAGTVEAVGRNVTQFKPGNEVFGSCHGAFAEYACASESAVILKPENVTFEQAAAVSVAARTALQGLRDHGKIQPGQKVLINGASGGVGTFAVQIAKAFGAEVTGVCSTRNVDMVRSLGADHVVDYTREDFTRSDQRYDLMLDVAGSRSWWECRRVLNPKAIFVIVGGPKTNRWIGPLSHVIKVRLASLRASQKVIFYVAKRNKEDLTILGDLIQAGKVTPVIDRTYPLREVPAAIQYLEEGHTRGKVVITVEHNNTSQLKLYQPRS